MVTNTQKKTKVSDPEPRPNSYVESDILHTTKNDESNPEKPRSRSAKKLSFTCDFDTQGSGKLYF